MDAAVLSMITSIGISYFTHFSAPVIEKFFRKAFSLDPSLEDRVRNVKSVDDGEIEKIFHDAAHVIDINAGSGSVEIDKAFLEAAKGIKIDHAAGNIYISGTTVSSDKLFTGGSQGAIGTTFIGQNTEMKTKGTSIKVGTNSSIKISGNAHIVQK